MIGSNSVVVIMGMHRSGTSLVARMFHQLGVNLGSDLMVGDEANLDGYFEDWDFVNLNNTLLAESGASWNYPEVCGPAMNVGDPRAGELIKNKSGLWGWKDNRTAFTFSAYAAYLDLDRVLFVVCTRDKDEIITSLKRTHLDQFREEDRTDKYLSELCDYYNLAIDALTRKRNRIVIRYEDLRGNRFWNQQRHNAL